MKNRAQIDTTIETLIEKYGLDAVAKSIGDYCHNKAMHHEANHGSNDPIAGHWNLATDYFLSWTVDS